MDRSGYSTRKTHLGDPDDNSEVLRMSPGERMSMIWQLTLQAWAFKEGLQGEPRLRRDVVRVIRGGR
jgi:hypothetical protein